MQPALAMLLGVKEFVSSILRKQIGEYMGASSGENYYRKLNRVAITGMGTICGGLGQNLSEVWTNLLQAKSGISKVERINTEKLTTKIAGEVKNFTIAEDLLAPKEAHRFDLFNQYALHATQEAYKMSGLADAGYNAEKLGCILGVGIGGLSHIEQGHKTLIEKGPRRVSPFLLPSIISNMAAGLASIKFNLLGPSYVVTSACSSSAHALSVAANEIMLGTCDAIVTGGSESVITELGLVGFGSMRALSKRNDEPERASRPFDQDRDGFVMSEGAGILVIENYEKAVARGARIYAEIVGHGFSSDAHHISAPHPEGDGAVKAMQMALANARISLEEIGYINLHGTSTPLGDFAETKAIKRVFGKQAYQLKSSSTKSMTGHLLGAAGGLETIFCVKTLNEGNIPPTINLDNPDPNCDLDYVPNVAGKGDFEYALNNSFGFGGTNSSIVLKRVS